MDKVSAKQGELSDNLNASAARNAEQEKLINL